MGFKRGLISPSLEPLRAAPRWMVEIPRLPSPIYARDARKKWHIGNLEPDFILLIYEMLFRPRVVSGSRRLRRRLVAQVTLRALPTNLHPELRRTPP